jgi:ribosomal protein S18 acetylase RimI-like enzyme
MPGDRHYPAEPAGPFPTPPASFADGEGRGIEVQPLDAESGAASDADEGAEHDADAELEALVEMYLDFDPSDRAQGIPPVGERRVRDWLDILAEGYNVVAWDGDRAVGHATLVPDDGAFELAIFVHQDYQGAGIGTRLIRHLLGYGASRRAERVWLTVERWNRPAVALYESQGFETTSQESFELEMSIRLDPDESVA